MASNPPENHTHHIQEYSGLAGFFKELQTKILAIEGVAQGSSFTLEMSSAGLSAALAQDRVILGDPGIYSWSGGILDISGQERLIYTSTQEEDMNRYLGYSVKLLQTVGGLFLMVGSPRHRYVGLVTVLQEDADKRTWKNIDSIQGKQVGSYFGAEISVSDVDQDGVTDLVLISAPHHYESKWSGQVSVCRFTKLKLKCKATLHGEPGHLQSQFGAAVSTLGDLDGDRFTEVAVGAPYEMDGRGALYIYKGGPRGLSAIYSQRLLSPPGILGFGLSIHGVLDMTADGLIDVIVGSWGHVTLHRSRPLLQVTVSVTSNQKYMVVSSLEATGCDTELTLEACVIAEILTPRYNGSLSMSVRYSLVLDSSKPESRMIFRNNQREINETVEIQRPGPRCDHYTISLQDCRLRDVSEVQVSLTAFPHQEESFWLLAPSSNLNASDLISFQMCEEGKMCEPDMSIKLSHSHLVVQDSASFSMFLSLHNISMRAHHTSLSARIPDGLRFRKANVTKASHWISLLCGDFREQMLTCNISHPFLKRGVWANLQIVFSIVPNVSWTDHILMAINVTSESNGNITVSSAEDEVPVLYPIHVISRSLEDSTKHIPFTSQKQNATAAHRYQIQNLGFDPVSIDLTVSVSSYVAQSDGVSWDFIISSSKDSGVICSEHDESAANQTQSLKTRTIVNQTWHCAMDGSAEMTVMITGLLKPMDTWKEERSVSVRSAVLIRYNELRYHSDMGGTFHTAQVVTQVELLVPLEYTVYIVGGTVGGLVMMVLISFLLYKCGFFRRYKDRMMDELPPNETKELALLHN
ncbi:integrin alpha-L-like [Leptodactylus fuscus]